MEVRILDLTRQYQMLAPEIAPAICEQLASGEYIGGKCVQAFEKEFAAFIGVKHAIALNSGTDALVIALRAAGIKPGDEVITTPFSFFATAETIATVGAVPVFADIDPVTYNLSPDCIEKCITARTKAILPVHIFGQMADMDGIMRIANEHSLVVIEDACQAVGASYQGKMAGSIGRCGCFSFFPTKNLGAFGDAGMITTDDDDTEVICRALREHGMGQNGAKAQFILDGIRDPLLDTQDVTGLYNPFKYYNYQIAYNSRMDAIQALGLSIKLKHLSDFNARRAQIAARYLGELADVRDIELPRVAPGQHVVWHQFALRTEKKNEMGEFLASRHVGSAAFYPVPLHLQKAFASLSYKPGDLPQAEQLTRESFCLPVFPELTEEEISYVIACVKAFFD